MTVAAMLLTNLPDSELRRQTIEVAGPYVNALGLDQNWGVFAPDPRREVIALEARVAYAGGGTARWRPPESGALVGAYRDYRWRKFLENAVSDRYRRLWRPTADFAVREVGRRRGGRRAVGVSLVRRFYELRPPGAQPQRGPWHRARFFERRLGGR